MKCLKSIFKKTKRANWALKCANFLNNIPDANRFGILNILAHTGGQMAVRNLKPHFILNDILKQTGAFIGDRNSTVKERAKNIWNKRKRQINRIFTRGYFCGILYLHFNLKEV
jgi:hypothetical protein